MPQNYTKKKGSYYKPDPKKYLYNIDTIWLNIDSFYYDEIMESGLRDLLIEGREYLSDFGAALELPVTIEGYPEPILFDVLGAQPPQYQYSIRNESMAFYFAKSDRENSSSMKIQINQFVLWEKGVQKAYQEALSVLKALGFLPHSSKLNRVDFACHSDQWHWQLNDFVKFEYPKNFKGDNFPNFLKLNPETGDFGTVYYGSRDRLFLRIYNKSKEIDDKKKYYFYKIYAAHDMDETKVWNVEFEVRRPFLKDLKKENEEFKSAYDDFEKCLEEDGLSALWSYLMARFIHDSPHWRILEKGDTNNFKQIAQYDLHVSQDIDADANRERAQIAGRLMTTVLTEEDYSLDHAFEKFKEWLIDAESSKKRKSWNELVESKKAKIHSQEINKTIKKDAQKRASKVEKMINETYQKHEKHDNNK